jgi:hypothetical protein
MKRLALLFALAGTPLVLFSAAEDKPAPKGDSPAPTEKPAASSAGSEQTPSAKSGQAPTQDELEAKFKTTMTNAVMNGRWCMVKDGQLQAEQEDKYTIVGVNKLFGDNWIVRARIQYGKRDVTAPIPVKVKWAGDTPVITVDGFGMPGGGSAYSARVLIYGESYAGTWSAGDHGGLMNGIIVRGKE